jgi:branched-chain amino acid transport system substrate-binding protein
VKARLAAALVVAFGLLVAAAGCGGAGKTATPVASPNCGPVLFAGRGKPRFLIVSDLPLRNPPGAREQVEGIEYVLRRQGFKAGRFTIGYQSCDNSSAAEDGFDRGRCSANAKVWAADGSVVGVIGPYNSPCAALEIPVADTAKAGPLVMIGTGTTDPTLTAKVPGAPPDTPDSFYPAHTRNFVRLPAPDQYQAAAAAMLAQQRHLRRVYVLEDGEGYGHDIGDWFQQGARKLGVGIIGRQTWNPKAHDYTDLVNQVKKANPDGVYLAGYAFLHGTAVLKQLRAALGNRVLIFAPDGFSDPNEDVHEAGPAANGLIFTLAGVPPRDAGPAGQTILKTTGSEEHAQYGALYGATATKILLDAIARSDGSRSSVLKNVFAASSPAGIIGPFKFDHEGDPTRSGVMIVQIANGQPTYLPTLYPTAQLAKGH